MVFWGGSMGVALDGSVQRFTSTGMPKRESFPRLSCGCFARVESAWLIYFP